MSSESWTGDKFACTSFSTALHEGSLVSLSRTWNLLNVGMLGSDKLLDSSCSSSFPLALLQTSNDGGGGLHGRDGGVVPGGKGWPILHGALSGGWLRVVILSVDEFVKGLPGRVLCVGPDGVTVSSLLVEVGAHYLLVDDWPVLFMLVKSKVFGWHFRGLKFWVISAWDESLLDYNIDTKGSLWENKVESWTSDSRKKVFTDNFGIHFEQKIWIGRFVLFLNLVNLSCLFVGVVVFVGG